MTLLAVAVPAARFAFGDSETFSVGATVNNGLPTIAIADQAATGVAGGASSFMITFNATDPNGYDDLNDGTARVVLTKGGEVTKTNSSCAVVDHPTADSTRYNCTFVLNYYDASGAWAINASVQDDSSSYVEDVDNSLTVGTLDAIAIVSASISFTGAPGADDVQANPNPQRVNNTGNQNYATVQVTGQDFDKAGDLIGVGNVTMNIANTGGAGDVLVDNSAVTLTSGSLPKGATSLEDIYFWLDIPDNTPSGAYSAQSNWQITVNT